MTRDVTKPPKPLFVPLNSEHYDRFENGSKTFELRMGPQRWNNETVYEGRKVTLSKGYGKQNRLNKTIGRVYQENSLFDLLSVYHHPSLKEIWQMVMPDSKSLTQAYLKCAEIYGFNTEHFIAFECFDLTVEAQCATCANACPQLLPHPFQPNETFMCKWFDYPNLPTFHCDEYEVIF